MPKLLLFLLLAIAALAFPCAATARAENWPAWRGPRGNSTSDARELPLEWSETSGVVWKAPLAGWGTSTPAVWNDAVFVTFQNENKLMLARLDRTSGQVVWTQEVGQGDTPREGKSRERQKFHRLHNLASPSPVTDGRHVVVHFGNGLLATYDFAGKLLWQHDLQQEYGTYTIWWGHANSPVLYDNLVISVCMQDSLSDLGVQAAPSYLLAHDVATGKLVWKSMRLTDAPSEQGDAYTTPIVMNVDGQPQLVVMGANQLDGYDPRTGKQRWFLGGLVGGRTVTGPTAADGLIYVTRGMRGPLLAVRPGGDGELPADRIAWQHDKGTPDTPCPVAIDGLLFTITDDGIARVFDAASGKLHWTKRLEGDYKGSPVAGAGRVYFQNTAGLCTVVAAKSEFEMLAENRLTGETLGSPAVAHGQIFVRTRDALYCLGTK
jgi:outer membrane protein assembly factor BamB